MSFFLDIIVDLLQDLRAAASTLANLRLATGYFAFWFKVFFLMRHMSANISGFSFSEFEILSRATFLENAVYGPKSLSSFELSKWHALSVCVFRPLYILYVPHFWSYLLFRYHSHVPLVPVTCAFVTSAPTYCKPSGPRSQVPCCDCKRAHNSVT